MASSFFRLLVISLSLLVWACGFQGCDGHTFSFKMHHRFSETVMKWTQRAEKGILVDHWPEKGTADYYSTLADRDRIMRGFRFMDVDQHITFADGNSTIRISSLGFLHYTTVSLGTPAKTFLVALDTGSDLFWVPCDCRKCAPLASSNYGSDGEINIYNPEESSTRKKVTCNNILCAQRSRCLGTFSDCPYVVSYVSADTSTSGILIEDVLHLKTEDSSPQVVDAVITFGCGQVQTGSFLDVAAPNGLFGLGMEKVSVPSILSREGLIEDSFSMCFGRDGVGRISFGDKGSPDQEETDFNINQFQPMYNISITQMRVGTSLIDTDFSALFDSGTSFTYLVDPAYTRLSEDFDLQAKDRRRPQDPRMPFEYCYDMSPSANSSLIPSMSLTMKGGSQFPVYDPIIVISTRAELVYCLAVVKSDDMNIIGQNFMTGYRIVFDRERFVLGWKKFDCYDIEYSNTFPVKRPNSTSVPPAVAVGPGEYSPEATKERRNISQISVEPPPSPSCSTHLRYYCFRVLFMLSSFLYMIF
ncbi:aspartyl protease family protein 1-like isoform X3 [Telopea speciosissima]|uniref:aspartyl protease family protein 1-like isoform X3 n=1 Tax=Telopea speciosissima TaxID=54955 RepID=UPI001CC48647|nr:aspartyl protease family protein 1-like isoform X3 [Telopea speciosissima]